MQTSDLLMIRLSPENEDRALDWTTGGLEGFTGYGTRTQFSSTVLRRKFNGW